LGNPTRQAVDDLLVRIRGGMPADQALDLMQQSVKHELLNDLLTAIRFNMRFRGDLPSLLEQMEWQMNKIEEEFVNRRLSNAADRRLTLLILTLVPPGIAVKLMSDAGTAGLFFRPGPGLALLIGGAVTYLAALAGFMLVQSKLAG
jgi:Flp pilus assembly protein TadB